MLRNSLRNFSVQKLGKKLRNTCAKICKVSYKNECYHFKFCHSQYKSDWILPCQYTLCTYLSEKQSSLLLCNIFIISKFNYCPLIWIFCGKSANNDLNLTNKRALRILFNDFTSSYEKLLKTVADPDGGRGGGAWKTIRNHHAKISANIVNTKYSMQTLSTAVCFT